jgi:opacity protein-like surface antigen
MKKTLAVLAAALCVTTIMSAQETGNGEPPAFRISLGGGGMLSANMSTWGLDKDQPGDLGRYNSSIINTAPFIMFDAKYIEANIGLLLGQAQNSNLGNPVFPAETLGMLFGAYLKLPFTLSDMFTLYPLAGARYDLYLLSRKSDGRDAAFSTGSGETSDAMEALSTVTFSLGAGLDTFFTEHLFLRTELLDGISLPNKMDVYLTDSRSADVEWQLSHSGEFKLAVGWRF